MSYSNQPNWASTIIIIHNIPVLSINSRVKYSYSVFKKRHYYKDILALTVSILGFNSLPDYNSVQYSINLCLNYHYRRSLLMRICFSF